MMVNDIDKIFTSDQLSKVVTLREVCHLWDKTPRTIYYAIDRDQVVARKSITGGSWLLTYESCVSAWGQPVNDIQEWMV